MPPRQRLSDEELFRLTSPSSMEMEDEEGPGWRTRLWEGVKSLGPFGGAAAMVRGLSGFLSPVKGGLPGAAFGGGAELLAQGIENIPRIPEAFSPSALSDIARGLREQPEATLSGFGREAAKSAGRVGVESAIGAVPFGAIMKEARPIGSAIRGAGMAGGGQAAHEAVNVAAGDEVDPNEALKRILFATSIGGGATGTIAGIHAAATRGLEAPPTPRGGIETRTYEVQPTAAIGGEVGIGSKRSKVLPIRPQVAHVPRQRVSQEVPYRMDEPSTPSQHLADQFLQALEEEQALVAPMRLGQRVAYGSSIEDVPMTRSARAAEASAARGAGAEATRAAREDERQRTALRRFVEGNQKRWEQHLADTEAAARIEAAKTGRVPEESVSETVSAPVPGGRETLRTRFVPEDPEAGPKRLVDPETGEVIGEASIRPPADIAQGQLYDALTARGVPHERALQIASTSSPEDALRRLAIVNKKSRVPGNFDEEPPPVAGAPVPTGPGPTPPAPAGAVAEPEVPYPGLNLSNLRRLLGVAEGREAERLSGMQARGGLRMLYEEPPTAPRTVAEPEVPPSAVETAVEEFPEVPITPPQGAMTTIPIGDVARNPLDAIAAQFRRVKAEAGELGKRDKSPLAEILRGRRSKLGAQLQNVAKAYPEWSNIPEVRGQAPSVSREAAIVEGALPPRGEAGPTRKVPAPAAEAPPTAPAFALESPITEEEVETFFDLARSVPRSKAGRAKTIAALAEARQNPELTAELDAARDTWAALNRRINSLAPDDPALPELNRARVELITQAGNVARYGSAALAKGLPLTGPQVGDAITRLRRDVTSLSSTGKLAPRGKPDITGHSGMANVELMSMLAGGLGGAALDPLGNPILSGLLGAGAGYALPRGIAKAGDIAEGLPETPDQWREGFLSAVEKVPQYQRATLLTQAGSSTIANTFVGPYGAGVTGAMEAIAKGDPRGRLLLKELGTPRDFIRAWREARPEAERLLAAGEEGRAEGLQFGAEGGWFDKATAVPGLWMLQGDIVVKRAAERAGFSPLEASQMSLTAEPTHPWIRPFAGLGRSSDPQQPTHRLMKALTDFLVPFKRTPANIAEAGLFRTPGLGLVFGATDPGRTWRDVGVEQLGGLLGAGVGYVAGSELDPESARVGRRVLTNFAGRYSAPVGLGFAMGQAGQRTGDPTSAFNPRSLPRTLGDIFPLPTVDPAAGAIGFLTEGEIPRGLLPGQEYIIPREPTIRETIEGIPPLPRYRSR